MKLRYYWAEFLGTYFLVLFGAGAIVVHTAYGGVVSHAGIAAVFGLTVMALIYAIGDVSGAHINPAVTLAFWASGSFPSKLVAGYCLSQLVGALLAAITLRGLFPQALEWGATRPAGSVWQAFLLEVLLSFFLMSVILRVSQGARETGWFAGLAIGAVVALEALWAGPVSGASMNPARSLGPALASGQIGTLWIYLTAPVVGMLLAVPAMRPFMGAGK